jgi:hypothetical protein
MWRATSDWHLGRLFVTEVGVRMPLSQENCMGGFFQPIFFARSTLQVCHAAEVQQACSILQEASAQE